MTGAIKMAAFMVAGLGVLGAPAVAAETDVTVLRGTASNAESGRVTLLRGWPAGAPRKPATPAPERDAPGWIATGGETLWLVERDGGEVLGCWLQGSTDADETDEIRCSRASLH